MCLPACIHLIKFSHAPDRKNSSPDSRLIEVILFVVRAQIFHSLPFSLSFSEPKMSIVVGKNGRKCYNDSSSSDRKWRRSWKECYVASRKKGAEAT